MQQKQPQYLHGTLLSYFWTEFIKIVDRSLNEHPVPARSRKKMTLSIFFSFFIRRTVISNHDGLCVLISLKFTCLGFIIFVTNYYNVKCSLFQYTQKLALSHCPSPLSTSSSVFLSRKSDEATASSASMVVTVLSLWTNREVCQKQWFIFICQLYRYHDMTLIFDT